MLWGAAVIGAWLAIVLGFGSSAQCSVIDLLLFRDVRINGLCREAYSMRLRMTGLIIITIGAIAFLGAVIGKLIDRLALNNALQRDAETATRFPRG